MTTSYSLKKCRNAFKEAVIRYKSLSKRLPSDLLNRLEELLDKLDASIRAHDIDNARLYTFEVQQFLLEHGKKSLFEQLREFTVAILFALLVAAIVRQTWFELYEIPTGSMRPTFLECDRVLVFKDTFCINKPFETDHFYFNPEDVKRGSIVVITGDKVDLPDVDTVYFGLFPGKRRYVKRSMAKDGDRIYFYGGKIYGIDKENNMLPVFENSPEYSYIEHIPFITFEGKVDPAANDNTYVIRHMNIPVAEIEISRSGITNGKAFGNFGKDWGIDNFAMSRLITPEDLPSEAKLLGYTDINAQLYLELKHSPKIPVRQMPDKNGHPQLLTTEHSWIGLDKTHIQKLKESLYTARFYVRKGSAFRYTPEGPDLKGRGVPLDPSIPDGCYEFYDGTAYEIGWGSIQHELPKEHAIYPKSLKMLKVLYNCGIDFSLGTNNPKKQHYFPSRYTYFRDGALYTLGKELFAKDDESLAHFLEKEAARPTPFVDKGAPTDAAFLTTYGLPIQDGHYLLLGDNHAMSNDSRFFGAVPQKNLQGSPSLIFWPPGNRWGTPPQPELGLIRLSNVVVVSSMTLFAWLCYAIYNARTSHKTFTRTRKKRLK